MNAFVLPPDSEFVRRQIDAGLLYEKQNEVTVPDGVVDGVSQEIYEGYRKGLVGACADVIVFTEVEKGRWKVLLSKRNKEKPFGDKWWMYGGAVNAYGDVIEFVKRRAKEESGFIPDIKALVSVGYTSSSDIIASTIQPCYLGFVPYEDVEKGVFLDKDHKETKLFTRDEYKNLPDSEKDWYVERNIDACFEVLKN